MPGPAPHDKSLARSLGEFFGHIWKGVSHDPARPAPPGPPDPAHADRVRVRESREEETRETPHGKVTIRRTIIEEVDLPRPGPEPDATPPPRPPTEPRTGER